MRFPAVTTVLFLAIALACASHPPKSSAIPARSPEDSLDALVNARCPRMNDGTATWRRVADGWHDDTTRRAWSNDSLRRVLLVMRDSDQAVRFASLAHEKDTALTRQMMVVDKANERRFEAILARYGWPTRSLVGADGETAAWLIVQHADGDSSGLQRRGLALMRAAAPGEVSPSELAYLTDRVRVNSHEAQLYGTQFQSLPDSGLALRPIEDEAHVEERRARVGIEPLDDYICTMRIMAHTRVLRHAPSADSR